MAHRQTELGQAGDHALVAGVAGRLQADQLVLERTFARLQEIDQHVHGAGVLARDLGAGDKLDARPRPPFCARRNDAVLAVVIGKGQSGQARLDGQVYQLLGRVAAVGDGRVGVQVDHRPHVNARRSPISPLPAPARARMDR